LSHARVPGSLPDEQWLRTEVSKISWFHSIPLGHGIVTGVDRSAERLVAMRLPEDLRGDGTKTRSIRLGPLESKKWFSTLALNLWGQVESGYLIIRF
jgi:hypothetical protein